MESASGLSYPLITVVMPVSVAPGICGSLIAASTSSKLGLGRWRKNLLRFSLGENLCDLGGGNLTGFWMKRLRKAETDTMRTAILHSCCCQKTSQTMSIAPLLCLMPTTLTMVTSTITQDRQSEHARPIFWRTVIRTLQRMMTGMDRTRRSLKISVIVVIVTSRVARRFVDASEHASASKAVSVGNADNRVTFSMLTKNAFKSEVRASQKRSDYADYTSKNCQCGCNPPPSV